MLKQDEKRSQWNFAIGLVRGSSLEPSEDFKELIEKEICGKITKDDMREYLKQKYSGQGHK